MPKTRSPQTANGSTLDEPTLLEDEKIKIAAAVAESLPAAASAGLSETALERKRRRQSERSTYQLAAIASSVGVTFLAVGAVWYRFVFQTQGETVPIEEVVGTVALVIGAAVGMEFWARWAHDALWHGSLWSMHKSHHEPREGAFELNDVFAIINAVPAIALIAYGFFNPGLVPGLCFGAGLGITGLGITVFGMAYMFVHDGLVHRRFPVGPIADVPYLKRVAAAHQLHHADELNHVLPGLFLGEGWLHHADKFKGVPFGLFLGPGKLGLLHHADKFKGVPFGLFLGPGELERVGGLADLEELLAARQGGEGKKQ
ncbi:unnamed protein product [Closterium sp. NIES-64]|nr:unnamed protein product [Closterium sp. NIES-64]